MVNTALSSKKRFAHVGLQQMLYNEEGNLSGRLRVITTNEMLLPTMREVILSVERRFDPNIIDSTEHQKWH